MGLTGLSPISLETPLNYSPLSSTQAKIGLGLMLALSANLGAATGFGDHQESPSPRTQVVGQQNQPLAPASSFGYYNGADFLPVQVDLGRISVRFVEGVTAAEAREILRSIPEVQGDRLDTTPVGDQGWIGVPLGSWVTEDLARDLARSLDAYPQTVYAMPGLIRTGEWLGLTNRIQVSFEKGVTPFDVQDLLSRHDLTVADTLPYVEHGFLLELPKQSERTTLDVARSIFEEGQSKFATPEFVVERVFRDTPNDTYYQYQWHLNATGTHTQWGIKVDADVDAPEAWDITPGGSSTIKIAIIDGGIEYNHEDLTGNDLPGWDYLGGDSNPSPSGSNDNHGTAVAGVACADGNNGKGVTGIAYNCKFIPIRLVGAGQTTSDEAAAISFAKSNGADIMNNSWGPPDGTGASFPLPANVKSAIDDAVSNGRGGKGCVIFWASGNGGESADLDGYASYGNVVCVAASTDQDKRASYSDFGNSVDICAPSNGGAAFGIVTVDRTGGPGYTGASYAAGFGGTSSSSPLAAGVGALVLSVNPDLTFSEVYDVLTSTADKIDSSAGGYDGNGHSNLYGFGKVNAFAAVVAALGTGGPPPPPPGGGSTQTFTSVNVPKSIPDNSGSGATSVLSVSGMSGDTTDFDVDVFIQHTYKGDLQVYLQRPDFQYILLHNKSGAGVDDVNTAYDSQTTPFQALASLFGGSPNGTWTLWAFDLAAQDTGSIQAWSLTVTTDGGGGGPSTTTHNSTDTPTAIPDNNSFGITSNLSVNAPGSSINDVNVTVDIPHTYKGDLKLTLTSPTGTSVILHNNTGGGTDNIKTTFDTQTTPFQPLSGFNGKSPDGTWRLKVVDSAGQDIGTLNSWSLQLVTQ